MIQKLGSIERNPINERKVPAVEEEYQNQR